MFAPPRALDDEESNFLQGVEAQRVEARQRKDDWEAEELRGFALARANQTGAKTRTRARSERRRGRRHPRRRVSSLSLLAQVARGKKSTEKPTEKRTEKLTGKAGALRQRRERARVRLRGRELSAVSAAALAMVMSRMGKAAAQIFLRCWGRTVAIATVVVAMRSRLEEQSSRPAEMPWWLRIGNRVPAAGAVLMWQPRGSIARFYTNLLLFLAGVACLTIMGARFAAPSSCFSGGLRRLGLEEYVSHQTLDVSCGVSPHERRTNSRLLTLT
ncbi:unnamed protein product [Laminaria digitata]